MFNVRPIQVALGVCALVATFAAPIHAQPNLKRWLFAEGSTNLGFGFEQEILIANPTADKAIVTLRFFPQDGSAPIVGGLEVQPFSRQGVNARQFAPDAPGVALEVLSNVDIVVERSMYWGGGLFNFGPAYNAGPVTDMRAGHSVMGVNAPMNKWTFAEGAADGPFGFQTYVLVSNPGTTDAFVQVRYYTNDGLEVTESQAVGAGARRTFYANSALLSTLGPRPQYDFAIEVESLNSVPVVAERAMYWGPNLRGGHAAVGVEPNSVWYFAEGIQGAPPIDFNTFILLYNPSQSETIDIQVDFFGQAGLAKSVTKTLPPRTRDNVWAAEFPAELAGADKAFSVRAVNTLGKPFVAERAVYWRGLREGTAAAGTVAPARKWGFADGQEGGFLQFQNPADPDPRHFSTYYQILNNTANPVQVRAVFFVEGAPATGTQVTVSVPALSRETIAPSNLPGLHNQKFAAFFEASDVVIVERATYWGPGIVGGHASAGAVLPDSLPALPAPTPTAAPTLTSISPNRGNPSGGTPVIITGTNLGLTASGAGNTTVHFGVTPTPPGNITVLNANQIRVVTPPSGKGFASVIVNTRGASVELPGAFEFFDPFSATGAAVGGPSGALNRLGEVRAVAQRNPFLLAISCGNFDFMYEVVAELRLRDNTNRWGLNWKRGLIGDFSHDIVNYYYGPEGSNMRNDTRVWIYDIIGGHCGPNPSAFWQDQTRATSDAGTIGRWTTEPMCKLARYRDAQRPNGEWLFPECR